MTSFLAFYDPYTLEQALSEARQQNVMDNYAASIVKNVRANN